MYRISEYKLFLSHVSIIAKLHQAQYVCLSIHHTTGKRYFPENPPQGNVKGHWCGKVAILHNEAATCQKSKSQCQDNYVPLIGGPTCLLRGILPVTLSKPQSRFKWCYS